MTDRIRVLWLIKSLGPGGAEQLLVSVAKVRDRRRFSYEAAYLLPWKDTLVAPLETLGVPVRCLDAPGGYRLGWTRSLRALLATGRYDIVHCHSPYVAGPARLLVRSLPRRTRPRLVYTEHNNWATYALPTRLGNAFTYPLDHAHLAVSDDVRGSVWPVLRRRVEVVVHGLLLDEVRGHAAEAAEARAELGVRPDEVLVCTVANLRAAKAYPDLLAAARQVVTAVPSVRFVAVGQGPMETEVKALHRRLGLGDRFRFLGYRADALRVLAASDIFVLASRREGFPLAIMEALTLGIPTVATAVGGVRQAVTDGVEGLVVPPARPDLLAAAIRELATDADQRAAMRAAAARRGDHFDIARAAGRMEALYEELTRGGRP